MDEPTKEEDSGNEDDRIDHMEDGDMPIADDVEVDDDEGAPRVDDDIPAAATAGERPSVLLSGPSVSQTARARRKDERVTTPFLTKYERARILGTRALQIAQNAPVMVQLEGEVDPLVIAAKELRQRTLPIIVRRTLPDNTYEDWLIQDLNPHFSS